MIAMDVSQMKDGDFAGLAALQKRYGFVGVKAAGDARSIVMVSAASESPEEVQSVPLTERIVFLKMECDFKNRADKAFFYYSLEGNKWTAIGKPLPMAYTLPHFMGYRFALFNYATKAVGGTFMVLAGISILLFWKVAGDSKLLNLVLLCASGFFIYGPQCLIGIAVANLATKRAAATAVGLTGLFGYFSKTLSGVGLGTLVEHYGWDAGFVGLVVIAAIGTMVFILAWPAKAHGYELSSTGSSTATDH
jgi:hypothetical protein